MFVSGQLAAKKAAALMTVFFLMSPCAQAQDAEGKLDLLVLNQVLGGLVHQVLVEAQKKPGSVFKDLQLSVDPKETDLSSPDRVRLKVQALATVNRTAWAPDSETTLELQLAGGADRVAKQADVDFTGSLRTEIASLGRFVAKELEPDYCNPKRVSPFDTDGSLTKRACEEIKRLESVADVGALLEGVARLGELAQDYNQAEVAQLQVKLQQETDARKKASLEYQLKSAQQNQQALRAVAQEFAHALIHSQDGTVFQLHFDHVDALGYGELTSLDIYIDKGELRVGLKYTAKDIKDLDQYFQMKPMVEQYLLGLQHGDAQTTKDVQSLAATFLAFVEDFVTAGRH